MSHALEVHRHFAPIAEEWDALVDRTGASAFLRPGWFEAWRRAFGRGRLEVLGARADGRLVGVCALERRAFTLRAPVNWHTPVWAPVAEDAAALDVLARGAVMAARPRLSLGFLDAGTDGVRACRRAASAAGCRLRSHHLERSPYLTLSGSWETHEGRLSAKRRSNLRRMWRRLEEAGEVRLTVHDGTRDLDALLTDGLAVEASGWKGAGGTAIASDSVTRRFYADVARWAVGRGTLVLAFLRLDGRPLAFDYAIEEAGVHSLLRTGYDESRRALAPGLLLRGHMIRRAFERGLHSYEFLGDALGWKLEWTDTVRERVAVEAFRPAPGGRLAWVGWAYARPAVKLLGARLAR